MRRAKGKRGKARNARGELGETTEETEESEKHGLIADFAPAKVPKGVSLWPPAL